MENSVGQGAQSKWGRHCCRPHSHRYVAVFLQPKFKGRRLGIRCFPFCLVRRPPFRFCHRRSHRHPDLPSTRPGVGRVAIRRSFAYLAQPRFNGRFRSLTFRWWSAPRTVTSPSGPKTFIRRHLRHPAGLAWLAVRNLRTSVIDPPCVRREPSARGSRDVRGQIPLRLSGSEFPLPFKSLDRLGWKVSSPFR